MIDKEKGIFPEANRLRSEIICGEGDLSMVVPPAIAALIFRISVANFEQMQERNQSLIITPLSPEKVRVSRRGFKGSSPLYRELCTAAQMTAEGRNDAFDDFSPGLEKWSPLQEFRERLRDGGGEPSEDEEMQGLLLAYWKTLKPAAKMELDKEGLNPSKIFSNLGLRRSGP